MEKTMDINENIRVSDSALHKIIMESIAKVISEDGAMGGGATAGATSDSADRQGAFDAPFGGVQRRKVYSPNGDKVSDGMEEVDMNPTLKRHDGSCGSISIPRRKK